MDAKLYNFNGPNSNNEIPAHDYVMSSGLNHVKTELQNQFCDYVKTEIEKAQLGNTKDGQGSSKGKVADTTVLDKLKHFMAMSTFHGISHISSSNQLWMRMFWLVLLLFGFGLSGWQIILLFKEYFKYPVLTEVKVHSGNLEYPDVTICNKNPYVLSKVAKHQNFSTHRRVNRNFNDTTDIQSLAYQLVEEIGQLSESERIALSHDAPIFIQFAQIADRGKGEKNRTKLIHHRRFGNCFTITPFPIQDEVHKVFIDVNVDSYNYLNPFEEPGIEIFVSEPGIFPFLSDSHRLEIKTPSVLEIQVDLEIVNRLNGSYGNCQDGEAEFEEETGLVYTREVCRERCRIRKNIDVCGCHMRSLKVFPEGYKIHNLYSRYCRDDKFCKYSGTLSDCSCKPKCRTKNYRIVTKKTKILGMNSINKCDLEPARVKPAIEDGKLSHFMRCNIIFIEMIFSDLLYKEFSEIPVYSFWRFLSDLGGSMGLYLGASILTLLEILQCIIGIVVFYLCRNRAGD